MLHVAGECHGSARSRGIDVFGLEDNLSVVEIWLVKTFERSVMKPSRQRWLCLMCRRVFTSARDLDLIAPTGRWQCCLELCACSPRETNKLRPRGHLQLISLLHLCAECQLSVDRRGSFLSWPTRACEEPYKTFWIYVEAITFWIFWNYRQQATNFWLCRHGAVNSRHAEDGVVTKQTGAELSEV